MTEIPFIEITIKKQSRPSGQDFFLEHLEKTRSAVTYNHTAQDPHKKWIAYVCGIFHIHSIDAGIIVSLMTWQTPKNDKDKVAIANILFMGSMSFWEKKAMELCSMRSVLPFVGMVIIMLVQVSNMEVIKAAMSTGMNKYVIIVYSDALSSLIFLLCSLLIHRSLYFYLPLIPY